MKNYLLIPLAGRGQRFIDAGYSLPKQMIPARGRTCIEWSFDSLNFLNSEVVFILRKDTLSSFPDLRAFLDSITGGNCRIVELEHETRGSLETCSIIAKTLEPESALSIFTGDVYFLPRYDPSTFVDMNLDGWLLSFKSNSNSYSYAKVDSEGFATETAEKIVISEHALVGIYGFKSVDFFRKYADLTLSKPPEFGGEYYIAPVFNNIIKDLGVVKVQPVDEMHLFGTPQELNFFRKFSSKSFQSRKSIGLASDHSGWHLKEEVKKILTENNVSFTDFGAYVDVDSDYPDFVNPAMRSLLRDEVDYVFSFCRSGQGVNLAASTFQGILSALVYDLESASLAVKHSAANVFSFPSKVWDRHTIVNAIEIVMSERFEGGRHQGRLMRVVEDFLNDA
jgi:RpiB/LacA/LacB family sugar-phosphate isomerase